MKKDSASLVTAGRESLLAVVLRDVYQNPLLAAFVGWLLREDSLMPTFAHFAEQAAAARGADRSTRNVAVLGFACGVETFKSRFTDEFTSQLEWSIGRPNFSAGGEPCGFVADPISFVGAVVGAGEISDRSVHQRYEQWAINIWKDIDGLIQEEGWRRKLINALIRRVSGVEKISSADNDIVWFGAALRQRGWSEPSGQSPDQILKAALTDSSDVDDGFEAGLRLAAINWAVSRINDPITLVLSGGGMRATLFQLGVVTYLASVGQLDRVRGLVSVSGGSILAAHLAVNWTSAIKSDEQFINVAASLLRFVRSDIRHKVLIPWIWSRLNPIAWFRKVNSRSNRLKAIYSQHFAKTFLGNLNVPENPEVAFVATDAIRLERIAFTARQVLRFPVSSDGIERGYQTHVVADSTGVPLALAVATSSCFPPVFSRMHLNHVDLSLHYAEFKDDLLLNDGGVIGNLGIEVLLNLHKVGWKVSRRVIIVDAERPQGKKPKDNSLADLGAQGSALSQAAIDMAKQRLGSDACFIRLSERQPEPPGLPFATQTTLALYRTDLDTPSWKECQALLLHGFAAATVVLSEEGDYANSSIIAQGMIAKILTKAGCAETQSLPSDTDFSTSSKRPKLRLILHGVCVLMVVVIIATAGWIAFRKLL